MSQFWSQKVPRTCKARIAVHYTPPTHLQGRNQATSLQYQNIPYIYNIKPLLVFSVQVFFKHCISFLW